MLKRKLRGLTKTVMQKSEQTFNVWSKCLDIGSKMCILQSSI